MNNSEILDKIQIEIGQWSQTNFGEQISKRTNFPLGELAPLIGLFEEYGELLESEDKFNDEAEENKIDALGDIAIYLLDFAGRCGISLSRYWVGHEPDEKLEKCDPYIRLGIVIGGLAHISLKSHQGIRQNELALTDRLGGACVEIILALESICKELDVILLPIIKETWAKVQQRNWKENPTSGT